MGTDRLNGSLYTRAENKIATIEFGHPASNSFPMVLLERLAEEFNKLSEDDTVHVIILKSEGDKTFCAGASFDELIAVSNEDEGKRFFNGFAKVINSMRTCKKIIVGRVQGKTVGGGVGLIAACDYAIATETAAIKLSELTIGIGPFVIAPALERKMGVAALTELTLAATEWKNAYWAKEKGLYTKVFESLSEVDKEINILTSKIVTYNPQAVLAMKEVLWEGTDHWESLLEERAKISGRLVLSNQTKETLERFGK